jgi:enoyl-CoA hydratase/carnithine racemase
MSSAPEGLRVEREGPVVTVTLDRPARRNALTRGLLARLRDTLAEVARDDAARCLVLTGAGGTFSSGVDLGDAAAPPGAEPFPELLTTLTGEMRRLDKPVLAAIEGPAYGAGLALALAADIRIVAEDAQLCEAYVRIGRFAGGGDTYWLPQIVGAGHALRMLWTGDVVGGREAVSIGLAEQAVGHGASLRAAVELARRIAQAPPEVVARTKHAVHRMRTMTASDALALSVALSSAADAGTEPGG